MPKSTPTLTETLVFSSFNMKLKGIALKPKYARVIFKASTRMYDIKANFKERYEGDTFCPFCRSDAENFEHIVKCHNRFICLLNTHDITLESFAKFTDARFLKRVGKYLMKHEKFGEVVI